MKGYCAYCGDSISVKPNKDKKQDNHFCDRNCYNKWMGSDNLTRFDTLNKIYAVIRRKKEIRKAKLDKTFKYSSDVIYNYLKQLKDMNLVDQREDYNDSGRRMSFYSIPNYMQRNMQRNMEKEG